MIKWFLRVFFHLFLFSYAHWLGSLSLKGSQTRRNNFLDLFSEGYFFFPFGPNPKSADTFLNSCKKWHNLSITLLDFFKIKNLMKYSDSFLYWQKYILRKIFIMLLKPILLINYIKKMFSLMNFFTEFLFFMPCVCIWALIYF